VQTILRWLAIVYVAYLAIALLVIMPALNFFPSWYVKQYPGRELQTEIILFNPFTVALEVREAELPEINGERFVGLKNAMVNLSLASLWREGWVFDELSIDGLYLHARQVGEEQFNFSDLLPEEEAEPEAEEETEGGIPGLTVRHLSLQAEEIRASNDIAEEPYSTFLNGVEIEVDGLSTIAVEGRPYHLEATGEGGGSFHWEGVVSIPGGYSEGFLALSQVQLRNFWRIAKQWLNFDLINGRFGIEGGYRVDWKDELSYSITEGLVEIGSIDIQPLARVDLPDTSLALSSMAISGVSVDSKNQHATITDITIDGLAVAGWMEGEQVSLVDLFAVHDLPQEDIPTVDTEDLDDSGWTAQINGTKLVNSSIRFRSEFTDPSLLEVAPLEASLGRINWPLAGDTSMNLNLLINEQVTAGIEGALDLGTGNGTLSYHLTELPLPWFNPNFPAALKAKLTDGHLATDGEVTLKDFSPATILNGGEITDFAGRVQDTEEALTNWDTVRWEELAVDVDAHTLGLKKIFINQYEGRIHIQKDGSINMSKVWQEEVGDAAQEVADELQEGKPWSISIPQILVSDSAIDFMDESLPIQFRTVIGDLNGEVLGISNAPGAQTQVDMAGSVDGYAPVTLKGTAAPLDEPPAIDLALNFTGVDLALLTPYSANYAGYAIERGLLTLKLQYALKDQRLAGNNDVVIDQLKLGEKIDSEQAVDLPLELALALLTDSNGVISMEVPVSGNVDDPAFDVSSVIAGAFMNVITKIVTAPFTLLANLVGSDEDLQRINFAIGSSVLDDNGKARLTTLNEALQQRPALKMVISGRLNLQPDRFSLQQSALEQAMLAAGLAEEDLSSKSAKWEKDIDQRYQALGKNAAAEPTPMAEKFTAVVQSVALPDNALAELAEARSVAVKTFLINEQGLAPDRAVIEQTPPDDPAHSFSGVELSPGG
jgi:hypothetical protein